MILELEFKDVKIGTMFLWGSLYIVKTKVDFGEYTPGKEFYFFRHDYVKIDDKCREYNEGLANDTGK